MLIKNYQEFKSSLFILQINAGHKQIITGPRLKIYQDRNTYRLLTIFWGSLLTTRISLQHDISIPPFLCQISNLEQMFVQCIHKNYRNNKI